MNTYTIRALTTEDAALVRLAGNALTGYDTREGLIPGANTYGTWDTTQAAKLSEHLRAALEIIERLTRPADVAPDESIVTDDDGAPYRCVMCNTELVPFVNDYGRARMKHTEDAKAACLNPAAGWYRDRPEPRSRVERVTGTGWPA